MFREDISWFIPAILLIFYQVFFIWGRLPNADHSETEIPGSYTGLDRFKFAYVFKLFSVIFVLQLSISFFNISNTRNFITFLLILGYLSLVFGFIIAASSLKNLGYNWTGMNEYRIKRDQKLITTGIYGLIRHPIYFAIILEIIGFELIVNSWLVIPLVLLGFFIFYKHIKEEEKLLEYKFKDEFIDYKNRVKMFIPYIF